MFPHFGGGASTLPEIGHSLRFNSADSAYCSRTFSSPTNGKKWTWTGWVKRANLGSVQALITATSGNEDQFYFQADNTLRLNLNGSTNGRFTTTAVFRDVSAHLHVVLVVDTANATATDRIIVYVNGIRASGTFDISVTDAVTRINSAIVHNLGRLPSGANYFNGYLSRICFVDGSALTPSDFAYTDPNGQWRSKSAGACKAVVDAGGTNSFMLDFNDGSSTTTLGYDYSAKGNNWTLTNFTRSAGVNDDWMEDTPTNNFCTLNPLVASAANISNGALASGTTAVRGTQDALALGGYWEVTAGGSNVTAGVISEGGTTNTTTVTANKTFGFRLSAAGALDYINITDAGSWTSITTGLSDVQFPYGTTAVANWNFGQRAFSGSPPTGFKALCTKNLPAGSVTTSGSFTGNAAADGPFVWLNGTPTAMTINGNAVTFGTHADKLANGFKLRTNSASYNASGSNTYSVSTNAGVFKYNNAEGNP